MGRGFPRGLGVLWVEGALLGSLERHSQGKVLGRDLGGRGEGEGGCRGCGRIPRGHGSIRKAPRRDHKGQVDWGDSECESSPAGDGDQTLDHARNGTLGLQLPRRWGGLQAVTCTSAP